MGFWVQAWEALRAALSQERLEDSLGVSAVVPWGVSEVPLEEP